MKKNIVAVFIFTIILCLSGCGLFEKDTQSAENQLRKTLEEGKTTTASSETNKYEPSIGDYVGEAVAQKEKDRQYARYTTYSGNEQNDGTFKYKYNQNDGWTVTGLCDTAVISNGLIIIPDEYLKQNVNAIGDYAFKGNTDIKYVDLGKVSYIGIQAFYQCTNLKEITAVFASQLDEQPFDQTALEKASFPSYDPELDEYFSSLGAETVWDRDLHNYKFTTVDNLTNSSEITAESANGTNEYMLRRFQEAHENDSSGVKYYCEKVEEMTENGEPCTPWITGGFNVTLYKDPNDFNSGEGSVYTIGLGGGYCQWSYMRGSGYYYIRWYPTYYSEGSYLDLISCHLTTDIPDFEGSFVG